MLKADGIKDRQCSNRRSPKPTASTERCEHDSSLHKVYHMAPKDAVKAGWPT